MRNTVVQSNALSLSSNVYMNSTTKFVKGLNIDPQTVDNNKNPTIIIAKKSSHQFQKTHNQVNFSSVLLPYSSPHLNQPQSSQRDLIKQPTQSQHVTTIESIAMNLSANIFMNSTTKFLKGIVDLSPLNNADQNDKKNEKQRAKEATSQRKGSIRALNIGKTQKMEPVKNGEKQVFTKKEQKQSHISGGKQQGREQRPRSSQKLKQTLKRNRFTQNQLDRSLSKSDSSVRLQRKKRDRTKQLKFMEPIYKHQSQSTIKDHHKDIQVDSQNANAPQQQQHLAQLQKPRVVPHSQKIIPERQTRKQINEVRSSDAKQIQRKKDIRPFTRHPQQTRPVLKASRTGQQQQLKIDVVQEGTQQNGINQKKLERVKSENIRRGQLLVQTPHKIEISSSPKQQKKKAVKAKPLQISAIKEQNSIVHDTLSNNRQVKKSTQLKNQHQLQNEIGPKIVNRQYQSKKTTKQMVSNQMLTVRSEPQIALNDRLQQTVVIASRRPHKGKDNPQVNATRLKEPIITNKAKVSRITQKPIQNKAQPQQIINRAIKKESQSKIPSELVIGRKTNQNHFIDQNILKANPAIKKYPTLLKVEQNNHQKMAILNQANKKDISPQTSQQVINIKEGTNTQRQQGLNKNTKDSLSKALLFIMQKWYLNKIKENFNKIYSASRVRVKFLQQTNIFSLSLHNLYKEIRKKKLQNIFVILKNNYLYKAMDLKSIEANPKLIASNLIFRLISSNIRQYMQALRQVNSISQRLSKFNYGTTPTNYYIEGKHSNMMILQRGLKVIESFKFDMMKQSFTKLYYKVLGQINQKKVINPSGSRNKPQRPMRNYQAQKQSLSKQNLQVQSAITFIQSRITDKRYYSNVQKAKLIKKQSQFIQKNKTGEKQLLEKRNRIRELTAKIEQFGSPSDLDITLPQSQPLVSVLTGIYSWAFSSKKDCFVVEEIREKYSIGKQQQNKLLKEWQVLTEYSQLKAELAQWEGPVLYNPQIVNSREIGAKVLQSYIRERYLWEFIKMNSERP